MAYPPPTPPNTRVNTTPLVDSHPSDHNVISDAITDINNELGPNPKGSYSSVDARITALTPGGGGGTSIPVATIFEYAGSVAPSGWLLCQGQSLATTGTYAALYAAIGYAYGGSGVSFTVPDFQDKSSVGKSATKALGTVGGVADTVVPAHTHAQTDHSHTASTTGTAASHTHSFTGSTSSAAAASGTSINALYGQSTRSTNGSGSLALSASTIVGGAAGVNSDTGVIPTDMNYSPYVVVNKIIRY